MDVPQKPPAVKTPLPKTIEVSKLSKDSVSILEHFGLDAPNLLNNYSIALEDALIEQLNGRVDNANEIVRLRKLLEKHNIPH